MSQMMLVGLNDKWGSDIVLNSRDDMIGYLKVGSQDWNYLSFESAVLFGEALCREAKKKIEARENLEKCLESCKVKVGL